MPLVDARIAALERTVAQLEHALAARVATERAIGVLAERRGTSPRAAFEELRRDARSQGRPLAQLAREVLDTLRVEPPPIEELAPGAGVPPVQRGPIQPSAAASMTRRITGPMTAAGTDGGF